MPARKFISISIIPQTEYSDFIEYAVADDGTAWWKYPGDSEWTQMPPLPDSEEDKP